eukprot:2403027-Pleurochrysis_carterae.AAC.4
MRPGTGRTGLRWTDCRPPCRDARTVRCCLNATDRDMMAAACRAWELWTNCNRHQTSEWSLTLIGY